MALTCIGSQSKLVTQATVSAFSILRSRRHLTPASHGFMLLLLIMTTPLQVVPFWPLHTNEPARQYKAMDIPDYSVDFATYQPMEPLVSLHPLNALTTTTPQR